MKIYLVLYLFAASMLYLTHPAGAETITITSHSVQPGDTVALQIVVDIPEKIAGAVFTVIYNSSYFTLTDIQSSFFDTFTNQWLALDPVPDPIPPSQVSVDGTDYTRPLLFNNITNATLIAAARVKAGASETTLFTLQFAVSADVPDGIYPVSLSATSLNNTTAGYLAEGETLPILIGMVEGEQDLSLAYPALSTTVINGSITINTVPIDTDGDGIADAWEIEQFENIDTANNITDYDKDGYTDLQEYLNSVAGETDPASGEYNATVMNAPGGTGYNPNSSGGGFWNLMLPVIIGGNR